MINYVELTNQLKEQGEHIISKLAIYQELLAAEGIEELSAYGINKIVDCIYDISLSNDNSNYNYLNITKAAMKVCNNDLLHFLIFIREKGDKLGEQVLEEFCGK